MQCGCYSPVNAISVVYIPKSHKQQPSSKEQAKPKSWVCWQEAGMLDTRDPGVEKNQTQTRTEAAGPNLAPHTLCPTGLFSGNIVGEIIFLLWNADLMHC